MDVGEPINDDTSQQDDDVDEEICIKEQTINQTAHPNVNVDLEEGHEETNS